jgi:hypothetical protein
LLSDEGPTIEVELLHSLPKDKRADIYLLVKNPNDFTVYVPGRPCPGLITNKPEEGPYEITHVECVTQRYPDDFVPVGPKRQMLFLVFKEYHLSDGINNLRVTFRIPLESPDKIPRDDVATDYPELTIEVPVNVWPCK